MELDLLTEVTSVILEKKIKLRIIFCQNVFWLKSCILLSPSTWSLPYFSISQFCFHFWWKKLLPKKYFFILRPNIEWILAFGGGYFTTFERYVFFFSSPHTLIKTSKGLISQSASCQHKGGFPSLNKLKNIVKQINQKRMLFCQFFSN